MASRSSSAAAEKRAIGGSNDPFARYKIPVLEVKHQGRGKMLLTCVTNLKDVIQDLNRDETAEEHEEAPVRDEEALLKFIAMKKGATVRLSKLGVSGSYSKKELTDILDEFISTYFLCSHCGNPETNVHFGRSVSLYCRACCNRTDIKGNQKYLEYLQKKGRKLKDAAAGAHGEKSTSKRGADRKQLGPSSSRLQGIEDLVEALTTEDFDLVTELKQFIAASPQEHDSHLMEIIRLQDAHHLSSLNTLRLLVRALFGDQQLESSSSFDTLKAIYLDHRPLFQELVKTLSSQKLLLESLRLDLPSVDPTHPGPIVHLANALYDDDIVTEDAFLSWEKSGSVVGSPLHGALLPFLQWLKTADEESDSDE